MTERTPLSSRRIYEGRVINLRVDEIPKANGGTRLIEVVEHPGGVVVIAMPAPREIVLVHQYRHPAREMLWEAPAGVIDPGEAPDVAALRELEEETGYRAERISYLWSAYSSPGFCEERFHFFHAEGLTPGAQRLDDIEEIEARSWPLDEAWDLVTRDRIRDAKTQIALCWAIRYCSP